MVYKVAKNAKVRGSLHNSIDRAMEKLIEKGTGYSAYKKDSKGYWLKMYIPQYKERIAKGIYRKIQKSQLN